MYQQFPQYPQYQMPKKTEIIHVNGRPGVDAFQMMPNCQALLLDDTAPLVWLVQTDGAGYKTSTPFQISPYEEPKPVDMQALVDRIAKLEVMVNESHSTETATAE
jgi:hypothetical protein